MYKILQVTPRFSPVYGGGGLAVTYQLSRALRQRGHEVTIYTSDFDLDQDFINTLKGVKVCPFHSWLNLVTLHITPSMITEAKRRLRDFGIIHLQSYRAFQNIVIHHYAKKYDIPYIVDAHGVSPGVGGIGRRMLKWAFDVVFGHRILNDASLVIAETKVGVNEYRKAGVNQDRIVLIYPPRNLDEFSRLPSPGCFRSKYDIKEEHVILFLGGIDWVKGLDFLVKSFHKLAQHRRDVILVIVGPDHGYKATLERLIQRLNLSDKVLFTGFLGGKEKLSALVDAAVVVQPSRYEQGLPLASLEALMCDTPIIVTRNTGAGEDVEKMDAGYLAEFGNVNELSGAMQHILENPSEATIKTKKGKKYIKMHISMLRRITEYEEIYRKCIEESKLKHGG